MQFASTITDFFAWWRDELSSMFPAISNRLTKPAHATLIVGAEGSLFPVFLKKQNHEGEARADNIDALNALITDVFRKRRETLEIKLCSGRCIERKIADIRLPASRAVMMADVDRDTKTPFDSEDVFVVFPERGPREAATRYFIFRKSDLQPLMQTVRRAGLKLTSIGIIKGESATRIRQRDLKRITGHSPADRIAGWMSVAIVVVIVGGIAGTWILEMQRLGEAKRLLSTRVDDAQRQAGRVRFQYDARMKLLDQMASIRNEKNLTNSAVYLWEQLSRTLPDESWLTDMKIADGVLTVSGYSQSAASLISLIEDADGFSDPEFKSAVFKAPNVDAERFTLQARIDGSHP